MTGGLTDDRSDIDRPADRTVSFHPSPFSGADWTPRRKRRVADGRCLSRDVCELAARAIAVRDGDILRRRGGHRAGRRARRAFGVGDAPRATLRRARDDAPRVAARGGRRRARRVDPRGGVLQLVAIRRVQPQRHERHPSGRRVPVRGRGAERRVPRIVRPGTSRPPSSPPAPRSRPPLSRAFPSRPPAYVTERDESSWLLRAPVVVLLFLSLGATTRRSDDARPSVPVPLRRDPHIPSTPNVPLT